MRTARSIGLLLVALLLVAAIPLPTLAQETPSITGGCRTVENDRVGQVHWCDHDRNVAPERVEFDLGLAVFDEDERQDVGRGHAEADEERRRTPWSNEKRYRAEVLAELALPLSPTLNYEVHARDRGGDGNLEHIRTHGGTYAEGVEDPNARYFVGLWDFSGDGRLETWGAQACTHATGCDAPDTRSVPDPPRLPDPTFYIEPVGWIP